jgi:hypothetical protein
MSNYNEKLSNMIKEVNKYLEHNITKCSGCTDLNCTDYYIEVHIDNPLYYIKCENCKNVNVKNDVIIIDGHVYNLPSDKLEFKSARIYDHSWKFIFTDINGTETVTIHIYQ